MTIHLLHLSQWWPWWTQTTYTIHHGHLIPQVLLIVDFYLRCSSVYCISYIKLHYIGLVYIHLYYVMEYRTANDCITSWVKWVIWPPYFTLSKDNYIVWYVLACVMTGLVLPQRYKQFSSCDVERFTESQHNKLLRSCICIHPLHTFL